MMDLPNEQQLFSSKDGSTWIPHLDGKPRIDIGDWLHQNLTWDEFQAIVNPPKSNDELFAEEMDAINNRYKSDTKLAIEKVSSAIGWDGATESTKVANARAELYQLKENYDTQSLAVINKYYGA